jgi:hypothetical protein
MARTINEIYTDITTQLTTEFSTVGIAIDPTKWSKRNLLRIVCYTVATAMAVWEQLNDVSLAQMEAVRASSAAASKKWLQHKMFEFQYSATDPQALQIINNVPQYPNINPALQLIKGCSVSTTATNYVLIKVAKSNPLTALTTTEISAAQGYINQIGTAGITYNVISLASDKVFIIGDVYYIGTYSAVIQQAVYDALNSYLSELAVAKFDGFLYALEIERTIRNVEGVNDVVIQQLQVRQNTQAVGSGANLIDGQDLILRRYQAASGYITEEPTTGYTFADTLNFIPE